jgi:hypothetical protein
MEHGSYLALDLSQGLYANGLFGAQAIMDTGIQELNTCSEDLASPIRTLGDLSVHFHVMCPGHGAWELSGSGSFPGVVRQWSLRCPAGCARTCWLVQPRNPVLHRQVTKKDSKKETNRRNRID